MCHFRAYSQRNEELEAKSAAKAADGSGADVDGGDAGSVVASVAAGGTSSATESKVCDWLEIVPVCRRISRLPVVARRRSDWIGFDAFHQVQL